MGSRLESQEKRGKVLELLRQGKTRKEICQILGYTYSLVSRFAFEFKQDKEGIKPINRDIAQLKLMCELWDESSPKVKDIFLRIIGARLASEDQYA
jgi:transcriptional regulator